MRLKCINIHFVGVFFFFEFYRFMSFLRNYVSSIRIYTMQGLAEKKNLHLLSRNFHEVVNNDRDGQC